MELSSTQCPQQAMLAVPSTLMALMTALMSTTSSSTKALISRIPSG